MTTPQFTVIIQGNLHPHSLASLDTFREVGPVIVSYWEGNDENLLDGIDLRGVTLIRNLQGQGLDVYNVMNIYFQVLTTMAGLYAAKTPYVIKVRSDEAMDTLSPVVDAVLAHPDRYVCADIYARPFDFLPNHPSDHLIAGGTALLLKTFYLAKRFCEDPEGVRRDYFSPPSFDSVAEFLDIRQHMAKKGKTMVCPEIVLGRAFLLAKGLDPDQTTRKMMQEQFEIVPSLSLGLITKHGLPHYLHRVYEQWPEANTNNDL